MSTIVEISFTPEDVHFPTRNSLRTRHPIYGTIDTQKNYLMYHPSWADLSEDMDEEIEHEIRAFEKMYRKKAVDDKAAEAEVQRNLEKYKQEKQK